MRRLNVPLVMGLLVSMLVLIIGVHLLHAYQVDRNARITLKQAGEQRENGELERSLKMYDAYLKQNPDDPEVYIDVAKVAVSIAELPRATPNDKKLAYNRLSLAADRNADERFVREQLAKYEVELHGRAGLEKAIRHIQWILGKSPNDKQLLLKLAQYQILTANHLEAREILLKLVGYDPKKKGFDAAQAQGPELIEAYPTLAESLRSTKPTDERLAQRLIEQMVVANPKSAEAYLARVAWNEALLAKRSERPDDKKGLVDQIHGDLNDAYKLAPQEINVLTRKLKWSIFDQDFKNGRDLIAQGLKEHKLAPSIYQLAAELELADKNNESAAAEKEPDPVKKKSHLANAESHGAEVIKYLKAGVEKLPKNFSLRYDLVERLMEKGEFTAARDEAKELESLTAGDNTARWQRDYADAQLEFVLEKNFQRAAGILENQRLELEARKQLSTDGWLIDQLRKVYSLLARCYEATGQSDQMLAVYKLLANLTPEVTRTNVVSQAGIARANLELGRRDEALQVLRRLRKELPDQQFFGNRDLWFSMLSALVGEQARLPKDKQDWRETEDFFAAVELHGCLGQTEHAIWRTDLYAQQDQLDKRATLESEMKLSQAALELDPKNEDQRARNESLRMASINLLAMQSRWPQALAAVDQALHQIGEKVNFRLRKAELLLRQNDQNTLKQELQKLESHADQFSADEQVALYIGLSVAHWSRGESDDVRRLLKQIIELKPLDPRPYVILFRNARDSKEPQALEEVAEAAAGLKRLLGANAREWKLAEATRQMMEYKTDREKYKENLSAIKQLLRDIETRSPRWSETDKLEAEVAEAEGNAELYFKKLEDALKHGPADPIVVRKLVPDLMRKGRRDDVQRILDRVAGENQAVDLEKVDVELKLGEDRGATVRRAKKLVAELPEDSENYRWLANLLSHAGEAADAEATYRKAISLAPKSPDPRLGLIQHLVQLQRFDRALDEIHSMETALPPERREFFLGRGYQILGDHRSAVQNFEEALQKDRADLNLVYDVVNFYRAANMSDKAENLLDKILAYQGPPREKEESYRAWARRQIVQIRAPRTSFKDLPKLFELLDQNGRNGQLPDDDLYLKAGILSQQFDSDSRRKAIDILVDLDQRKRLGEVERLLLATLYEQVGNWSQSQKIISSIVTKHDLAQQTANGTKVDPTAIARYADALSVYTNLLFDHNELDVAAGFLARLMELQPNAPRTIKLRARLFAKQGRAADAKEELKRLIPQGPLEPEQEARVLEVANDLRSLQLYHEAEEFYQRYFESHPQAVLAYADFLGKHSDLNKAFDLCESVIPYHEEKHYMVNLMSALQVAVSTLRARQTLVTNPHYERVQKWIETGLSYNPGYVPLELKKAELLDLRGRDAEVEAIYRRVLKLPPQRDPTIGYEPFYRVIALNNLAYMLATANPPRGDEALTMIDEVIDNLGPQRGYLDTRAMCYLAQGEVSKALADLNLALLDHNEKDMEDKSYAMKYCHMALAQHQNQDDRGAQQSLNKAKALGLTLADFPIRERPMIERLEAEVAAKSAKPAVQAEAKDASKSNEKRTSVP